MNANPVGTMNISLTPQRACAISNHVGLRGIAAVLPPRTRDLVDLQGGGLLVSDLAALKELGFEKVHVCDLAHDVGWMALESSRRAMHQAEVEPAEIDVLIWASALTEMHVQTRTQRRECQSKNCWACSTIGRAGCRKNFISITPG